MPGIASQTITIKVDLSCCNACLQRTKKLLQCVKGMESLSIDVQSGTVIVSGHIDQPQLIVDEITKNGNVVTFYSVQSDDGQHQPISKPDEQYLHESSTSHRHPLPVADDNNKNRLHGDRLSNKEFGECSHSASQRQMRAVADDNNKCRRLGGQQSNAHVPQVNENINFHDHARPRGNGREETEHNHRPFVNDCGPQVIGREETEHRAFIHETECHGIGGEETEHIRYRAFTHDTHHGHGHERVHFRTEEDQTRQFYAVGGVQSHDHGNHHSDHGGGEWHFSGKHACDPSWSYSDVHNYNGPHQVHHAQAPAQSRFNSNTDLDSTSHHNYMHYPEKSHYQRRQIPRRQFKGDPIVEFVTQFFKDDNPSGCWVM